MGSLCSKSGAHSSGHTVLASSSSTNPGDPSRSDPRTAAAEAAERRLKTVSMIVIVHLQLLDVHLGAGEGYIRL